MIISIFTGLAAGAVHVIGGPDHLLAMAPTAFQQPKLALRNGISWGIGHSIGIIALSLIAITLKDLVHLEKMSFFAELIVGVLLLVLGFWAIKTSLGLKIHTHQHQHQHQKLDHSHKHFHLHFRGNKKHGKHSHAFTSLGMLHGLAGTSHLLAVLPALALSQTGALFYIFSYLIGSIISMSIIVLAMSFATMKAGKNFLPIIMRTIGIFSVLTGLFWIQKTSYLIL